MIWNEELILVWNKIRHVVLLALFEYFTPPMFVVIFFRRFWKTILTISLPSPRTWTTTPIARAKWWGSNLHHDHIHLLHFKRGLHLSYPILFLVLNLFPKPLYQCDFFQSPENPVVSPVSGCVFERRLIVSSFLSRVNTLESGFLGSVFIKVFGVVLYYILLEFFLASVLAKVMKIRMHLIS